MEKIKKAILNRGYYRNIYVLFTIFFATVFFGNLSLFMNFLILVWGGIIILHDLFTKRIMFKSKLYCPLFIFMIIYVFTIVFNRDLNFFSNIRVFMLTGLQFFVVFIFDMDEDKKVTYKNIISFNNIIIIMSLIGTSISLLIYLVDIGFMYNNSVVGSIGGMLSGIYIGPNTAGPLAAISIVVTIINYELKNNKRFTKIDCLNFVLQIIFLYMTNSRGALYSFMAFGVVFVIFYIQGIKNKIFGSFIIVLIDLARDLVNKLMYKLQQIFTHIIAFSKTFGNYINNQAKSPALGESEIISSGMMEKVISEGFLNGRAQLWNCGAKIIKDNPLFGVGSRNVADVALTYDPIEQLPGIVGGGMHNIILQVVVSNGILGLLDLIIFIVSVFTVYFKYLWTTKAKTNKSRIVLLVGSLLVMLLVNNMVEANILYSASFMAIIFWTYLGFGLFIIKNDPIGEIND